MKKTTLVFILTCIFLSRASAHAPRVAVFDFDDRLAQEATTAKYIETQLSKKMPGVVVDQYSGKKSVPLSIDLLQTIDNNNYDLLIIITSDALIIANHIIKNTPTLFTNVNNPMYLGLKTLGPPGGMISGASYYIPVEKQLALYMKIIPGLNRIGFIFDRNNKSKKVELPEVRNVCERIGVDYMIEMISSDRDLYGAATKLINGNVQALVIGSSDLLYDNITLFLDACNQQSVPVFSFNRKGVMQGALAALSSDYNRMADELIIPMAVLVLEHHKSPGDMPVGFLKENRIYININQARMLGLDIPQDIIQSAVIIP
ncbi:MAG: hypothetical protein D3926_20535 [Desulfobacteraceae bacterium]|nr:MAG: hypothetical protein D3926_20535 [Desulfobacteraceae bacterium]